MFSIAKELTVGASAINCGYAASRSSPGRPATTQAIRSDDKGRTVGEKISRNVSLRVVSPACMAGVRTSCPNLSAL